MGDSRLGKLHSCSEITSGSWDAPDYPTCSRTYSLAEIRPRRVIRGQTEYEYCTMILLPKPSQSLPHVSLLRPGIPDCRFPWAFSRREYTSDVGNSVTDHSLDHITRFQLSGCLISRFYGRDTIVHESEHYFQ
jgi:hypothetical protein